MAQLDDIEQVERELDAFRARVQEALKSFERLEELISEFTKTGQAYETEVASAVEVARLLEDKLNEIDQNWLRLKSEADGVLELLNRSEVEREGRWVQYNKENKKVQDELRASWQEVQTRIEQLITDLTGVSEQHFAEVAQGFDLQASKLDDLQSEFERRLTTLEEDLAKTRKDLIAADRNQRTQLEQMITELRDESDQHIAEAILGFDSRASRLDGIQSEFERRWATLEEDLIKMQNDLLAANGDLRTASWKMIDDIRSEADGRFSEINKSIARQAARLEETSESIVVRIDEANNRWAEGIEASRQEYRKSLSRLEQNNLVIEQRIDMIEASRQEYRKSLSRLEQNNLVIEQRIDRLQMTVWVMLAIVIIAITIIIYITY